MDFAEAIDNSDLEAFEFTDDFIIELWVSQIDLVLIFFYFFNFYENFLLLFFFFSTGRRD